MRIERNAPKRRLRRFLPGRRGETHVDIALPSPDALFAAPEIDPFSPRYDDFEDRAAIDALAFELQADRIPAGLTATFRLPEAELEPGLEERVQAAIGRYCAKKVAGLDLELRRVYRHGFFALLVGFLAVIVLNSAARALADETDDLLQALSDGLQVISWVTLWFPVNLLVYDRWYYKREQQVYRVIGEMAITVRPDEARSPALADRSTGP